MSYLTLEVEIDHGRVSPKGSDKLPERANGLLTILAPVSSEETKLTPLQALDALQNRLQVDQKKAADWMAIVREARR